MIPYIHVPSLDLGVVKVHPFGVLVALAVLVGTSLAKWRAAKLELDLLKLRSFTTWMLVAGFIGGHVLDGLLYRPRVVLENPLWLLEIWNGQGSYGGFAGALLGVLLWRYLDVTGAKLHGRATPEPILGFADLVLSVFPVAWTLGRMGCSLAHDHPGVRASEHALLAVGYGPTRPEDVVALPLGIELRFGHAPRFDLGLLEMLFAAGLACAFAISWRWKLPRGCYVAATALSYAPARFVLDSLRARDIAGADARYLALTPAQWACIALFAFGLSVTVWMVRAARAGSPPRSSRPPAPASA